MMFLLRRAVRSTCFFFCSRPCCVCLVDRTLWGLTQIAAMLAKHHAEFDFTCMEMRDNEQVSFLVEFFSFLLRARSLTHTCFSLLPRGRKPASCACGPAELVDQTEMEAFSHGICASPFLIFFIWLLVSL